MQNDALFLRLVEQPLMIARLMREVRETSREFREEPWTFIRSVLKRDPDNGVRRMLLRVGFAIAILFYATTFISMLLVWSLSHKSEQHANYGDPTVVIRLPGYLQIAAIPDGSERPGGGGGGGRRTLTDPSFGELPKRSLTELIIAPSPNPQLTPPALPMIEKVMVDPRIQFKEDDLTATGLPDSLSFAPSAGQGSEGGIGVGSHGGIGIGDGPGVGPGSGGNIGGRQRNIGTGRPHPIAQQQPVDERPVLLNQPHPLFTEEARKNKVQGVVRVKVLVDADGVVKEVIVTRGLPDGLNEQAIRAAYQMRFRPAMKSGQPVSYWLSNVEVEFNLR